MTSTILLAECFLQENLILLVAIIEEKIMLIMSYL